MTNTQDVDVTIFQILVTLNESLKQQAKETRNEKNVKQQKNEKRESKQGCQ